MLALLVRLSALALATLAWLALGAYWIGRLATDEFHLTQFLFYTPGWLFLAAAATLAACVVFLRAIQNRIRTARLARAEREANPAPALNPHKSRSGRTCRIAFVAILGLAVGHLTLIEYRLWRVVLPASPATGKTIRIAHWNAMAPMPVRATMFAPLAADPAEPPGSQVKPLDVLCWSAAMSPMQARDVVLQSLGPSYHFDQRGILFIASPHPILSVESFQLSLAGPIVNPHAPSANPAIQSVTASESRSLLEYLYNTYGPAFGLQRRAFRNADPGTLLVAKVDIPGNPLGRPLVIYYIDLPSDPLRAKRSLAEHAARTIASLRDAFGTERLPSPDILLGDFNIPRGSASLNLLAPGMTSAFDSAGYGIAATWPYARPLINIDHLFVAPPLRVTRFNVIDPHMSDHMAIGCELTIDPPK